MNQPLAKLDTARAQLPDTYCAARKALQECIDIDECKDWSDKAAALASYGRMAKDVELRRMAMRIQLRALDRIGELIKLIPTAQGTRNDLRELPPGSPREQARAAAGLSEDQAKTAIRLNNIPRDVFEAQVERDDPPSVTALASLGTVKRPGDNKALDVVADANSHMAAIVKLMVQMTSSERVSFRREMIAAMSDVMIRG